MSGTTIHSTASVAKGISIKREKDAEGDERVTAHLKLSGLLVSRDELDWICGQPSGWAVGSFYDEVGAPLLAVVLRLPRFRCEASVRLRRENDGRPSELTAAQCELSGVELAVTPQGALLSCSLAWEAAGDEISDVEELLGRDVGAELRLHRSGQERLL